MWLLIDDVRDLKADVIARTAQAGWEMLSAHSWDGLLLDHDLGEETTGYDLLCRALDADVCPKTVILVTSNPVGKAKFMVAALMHYGYVKGLGEASYYKP